MGRFDHLTREMAVQDLVLRTLAEIGKPETDRAFRELTGVEVGPFWAVSEMGSEMGHGGDHLSRIVTLIPVHRPGDADFERIKLMEAVKSVPEVKEVHFEGNFSSCVMPLLDVKLVYPSQPSGLRVAQLLDALKAQILTEERIRAGHYKAQNPDGTYVDDYAPGQPVVIVRTRWKTHSQEQYQKSASGLLFVPRTDSFRAAGRLPHNFAHIGTVIATNDYGRKYGLVPGAEVCFKQTFFARWMPMADSTLLGWVAVDEVLGFYEDSHADPFAEDAPTLLQ